DGAAKAYEAIVKRDPSDGRAWFRLGQSLHSAGKYAGAADAFQRAAERGFQAPGAMVRAARAYARMNEKDKAIEWLDKGVQAGFGQYQALGADADMASLRDEARFKDAVARAERNAKPCASTPEHRQFDFWVGEWDVQTPQGQLAGTNSVQSILDGCVVFENWAGAGGGGSGKSFNYYNPATRRWHQLWVSNTGNVLEFAGELKDGQMRYTGESPGAQGGKVMHRLTFFNSSADRVRQLWEQSADGGRTWNVAFDGTYVRKK
ncbi:MAG: tetratricopeptide repeat protein, partial [Pyrinomonadaceae bacterium]